MPGAFCNTRASELKSLNFPAACFPVFVLPAPQAAVFIRKIRKNCLGGPKGNRLQAKKRRQKPRLKVRFCIGTHGLVAMTSD